MSTNEVPLEQAVAKLEITRSQQPELLIASVNNLKDTAIERSEARYFTNTAPRDSACESVVTKLAKVLRQLRISPQEPLNKGPPSTQATQEWYVPCIFNGSGSGKTFFNHFLLNHIRAYLGDNPTVEPPVSHFLSKYRVLRVWIAQFNGQQVQANEADLKLYMCAVIASQLLLEKQSDGVLRGVTVSSLLKQIHDRKEEDLFTDTSLLLQAIRKVQNIPADEPFLLLFGHDEMQMLTDATELRELDSEKRKKNKVYQYIVSAMDFTLATAGHNVAVFNLFTGTFPLNSTTLLAPTIYQWSPITFNPLTPANGIALLKSQHPSLKYILENEQITMLLEMFGNVPRVWELFSKELQSNPNAFTPSKTRSVIDMCNTFAKQVERWSIPPEMLHNALLVMVQRWTLEEIKKMKRPEIVCQIEELIYDGRLFTRDSNRFFIPIISLRNAVQEFEKTDPCRIIFIEYMDLCLRRGFDDRHFEQFCLTFFVMKFNLFVNTKFEQVGLDQFFRGAWMTLKGEKIKIRIGNKLIEEVYESRHNMTSFKNVAVNSCLDLIFEDIREETPLVLWVGKTDVHQDALLLLPDNVSIQLEMKFSTADAQATFVGESKGAFTHEQEMAEKSPVRLKKSFFIYMTNQSLSDKADKKEHIHDRSFIVCEQNFSEFFSGIFSFLTKMYKKK